MWLPLRRCKLNTSQSAEEEDNVYREAEMRGEAGLSTFFFLSLVPLPRGLSDLGLQETPRYLSYNDPFFLKAIRAGYLQQIEFELRLKGYKYT